MLTLNFIVYRVCAWCHQPLGTRATTAAQRGAQTHGICKACLEKQVAEWGTTAPAPTPAAGARGAARATA